MNIRIIKYVFLNRLFGALLLCALLLIVSAKVTAQTNLDTLRQQIENGNTETKRSALFEIRNLRSAVASRIAVPALADKDEIVRATAAGSVVFLREMEVTRLLLPLLADKSEMVRREAAYALGEAPDKASITPLIGLLQNDKIIEVKGAAVVALGKIGEPSAVDVLEKMLQSGPNDDNEFLRRSAARSIGQIAQIVQTDTFDQVTPQNFLPDKYKRVEKPKYADLVAQFPVFKTALPVLIKVLQNKKEADDTRREAAYALGAIGDRSAVVALQDGTKSEDPYLAEVCKEALSRVRARE